MTSEERREARYQRRRVRRQEKRAARCAALGTIDQVFSYRKMFFLGRRCCNGVRWKQSVQNFENHLFSGTARRRREILSGTWKPGKCVHFTLCERGKVRPIDAPHITDRQVHKTLCNEVLIPLYNPSMIYDNGASQRNKGLHWHFRRLKEHLHWHYRRYGRAGAIGLVDLKAFFPGAPRQALYQRHQLLIPNPDLRRVADTVVDYAPSTAPGRGMPLGVEPSQQEMVALPSAVDNWLKCQVGIHCAGHYMDDYYIIMPDVEQLKAVIREMVRRFETMGIRVNKRKCKIIPLTKSFRWCKARFTLTETGKVKVNGRRDQTSQTKAEAVSPGIYGWEAALFRGGAVHGVPERILPQLQRPRTAAPLAAALSCDLFWRCKMYKIIKDGTTIGLTEFLTYIKQHDNGCFVLCPEPEASGIAFDGKVYHLLGREALEGVSTVMLEEVDAGSEITKAKETNGIVFVTLAEAGSIDDATAAEHADLFAEWAYPVAYKVGQIRRYNGTLYKCVQDHTSQAEWTPDEASSLWAGTSDPTEEWPVGAHDTYSLGAKVSHNGKHWISSVDNNVWEPGVYGWTEQEE